MALRAQGGIGWEGQSCPFIPRLKEDALSHVLRDLNILLRENVFFLRVETGLGGVEREKIKGKGRKKKILKEKGEAGD